MILEFEQVSHTYHSQSAAVQALADIDLSIKQGDFFCLLGPSGCGKSTLLNMAAGFLKPEKGMARSCGKTVEAPGRERAVVFQGAGIFPWLTVEQNIMIALEPAIADKADKVDNALEIAGLKGFHSAMPHELSGGMRQKVAIARALAMDSELLLMDEPFAGLDEQTRLRLNREMVDIWRKSNKTVFFITHSIQEAVILGSRLALLTVRPGRIKKEWKLIDEGLSGAGRMKRRLEDPGFLDIASEIRNSMELCCPPGQPCRC